MDSPNGNVNSANAINEASNGNIEPQSVAHIQQQSSALLPVEPTITETVPTGAGPEIINIDKNPSIEAGDNIFVRPAPEAPIAADTSSTRGRGGTVRARGRGRGGIASTKPRKRRRKSNDEDDGSTSDEICTPTAITTKSGRNVQRPTTFVPPTAGSPADAANGAGVEATNGTARVYKKKRVWRRNADNAVCKSCLRGTSPASNMIVFCDGCNTPYHRWCHHPPISQKVIDEADVEWYCRGCARERVVPVPESEVAHWVAAPGAASDERRQFFLSLTPGTMVTLLLRAANLRPDLPIFAPEWTSKATHRGFAGAGTYAPQETSTASIQPSLNDQQPHQPSTIYVQHDDEDEDEGYGAEEHPPHYVRPGKGLMSTLPPDKDDERFLVDEEGSRGVFHHVYLVDESTAAKPGNSNPS